MKIMRPARPSRRAVLRGKLTSGQESGVHISSAIVSVLPNRREEVIHRLRMLQRVDIHHTESFKIVIVLEADDAGANGSQLAEIATWSGVLSANMVFEQPDDIGEST